MDDHFDRIEIKPNGSVRIKFSLFFTKKPWNYPYFNHKITHNLSKLNHSESNLMKSIQSVTKYKLYQDYERY